MNWATAKFSAPTGFEMFLLEHFGLSVDLSNNIAVVVVGMAVLMLPFFMVGRKSVRGL